ncbi:MAG: cysteine--tRNA ligase [Candidatus Aenigmatarchaeota archaeon]
MVLRVYNTLTRRKELFKPIKKNQITMYTCGPTVYGIPHIGNHRSFVIEDMMRRYLEFKGFKVKQVMNITDIDDKTIRNSGKIGISLKEFTEKYIKIFFEDLETLNIEKAFKYPKATEHFKEMVKMIETLVDKGYAYEKMGSIYFDISKFKDYGKLSKVDLKGIKPGARVDVDEYEKDNPQDFVLLKRSTTEELKRGIFYETEWGKTRPGWHIECSTMSMKYLGETIDIHTGGVDNMFPHHENEIAQSEAFTGKKFVNYWLHIEHLIVNGEKMSKSLGNFVTLRDLLKKGYNPRAIRYVLMSAHYKSSLNFTDESVKDAEKTLSNLNDFVDRISKMDIKGKYSQKLSKKVEEASSKFENYMDDDFNIPQALSAVFELIHETNKAIDKGNLSKKNLKEVFNQMIEFDKVLAVIEIKKEKLPKEISDLIMKREGHRKMGNFEAADKIRKEMNEKGYWVEDSPEGPRWKKVK